MLEVEIPYQYRIAQEGEMRTFNSASNGIQTNDPTVSNAAYFVGLYVFNYCSAL
jgi:hypothetical protein